MKLAIVIVLASLAAACTITPGNWPGAKGITVKPAAPNMNKEHGDWQHENRPSAN